MSAECDCQRKYKNKKIRCSADIVIVKHWMDQWEKNGVDEQSKYDATLMERRERCNKLVKQDEHCMSRDRTAESIRNRAKRECRLTRDSRTIKPSKIKEKHTASSTTDSFQWYSLEVGVEDKVNEEGSRAGYHQSMGGMNVSFEGETNRSNCYKENIEKKDGIDEDAHNKKG